MHARVKLTTEEGIRDFLAGRIDRFSISWFKRGRDACAASAARLAWARSARMCRGERMR